MGFCGLSQLTLSQQRGHFSLLPDSHGVNRWIGAKGMVMCENSCIVGTCGAPGCAAYAASKAAVISMTRFIAAAVGCHGITVNAICPGVIATPMWDKLGGELSGGSDSGRGAAEMTKAAASRSVLTREETPEDVANAVAFLVSEESSYITSQAINVDGGIEMD